MKKHDTTVCLKIPRPLLIKLDEEAVTKGINRSQLIRRKIYDFMPMENGQDVPTMSLQGEENLLLQRCLRCGGLYRPQRNGQYYCCNNCGCNKPCNCGTVERQRLLII